MQTFKLLLIALLTVAHSSCFAQKDDRGYIVKVGDMAPDITITYIDGTVKKLSDLRGKIVMLQFTAGWCGVCRIEMPFIEQDIWLKNKENPDFALIGIDLKESKSKVNELVRSTKVTYPITLDPEGKAFYSFAAPNAGVTRNVIINREGKIVYLTRLYDKKEFAEMVSKIEELLNDK